MDTYPDNRTMISNEEQEKQVQNNRIDRSSRICDQTVFDFNKIYTQNLPMNCAIVNVSLCFLCLPDCILLTLTHL